MSDFRISFSIMLLLSLKLSAQYMPIGFEELSLGADLSSVISHRPNVKALNLGPETQNTIKAENLENASALIEVNPSDQVSAVLYQFRESRLSGISFSYSSSGQELLQRAFKEHGSFDGVEASAEKNLAMIKWNVDDSVVYLSLPIGWSEGQNSQASYQIMSKEEAEDFVFFRTKELATRETSNDRLEEFAAKVKNFETGALVEPPAVKTTTDVKSALKSAEKFEEAAQTELLKEEELAEKLLPEEKPVEQPSQWWLWLVGALVVVGGLGLVLRRKS